MARTTNFALLPILIFVAHAASQVVGDDLGVIGLNQLVYGNGTISLSGDVQMQFTIAQGCYSRLTLDWDPETTLRSDLDFSITNSNNIVVILALSQRVPETTTFIMDLSDDDFGNGTFVLTVRTYEIFVATVPFGFIVETSSSSFCEIADDQYENNQAPLDSFDMHIGKNMELSMCNDDWFTLDLSSAVDIIYVTAGTEAAGKDVDFYILDSIYTFVFQSNNQGNEEDIIVALNGNPPYYIMVFEANASRNYTYTVKVSADEPKSKSNTPLIVGLVVGLGAVAIVGAIAGIVLFRRHRAKAYRQNVKQFVESSSSNYDQLALQSQPGADTTYASITRKSQVDRVERSHQESAMFDRTKKRDNFEIDYSELKIIKEIGKGSFGVVYQAQWRQTAVAVKQLKLSQMFENVEKGLEDFKREAELLKSLRPHPNVVLFLGITTEPLSIVIEYCDGGSLVSLLRDSSKTINFETQIKILSGIARGMLHLHTENIIHRDLAARNILLGQDYIAKVSDFGLSREKRSSMQDKTQSTIGPLKWMSVEAIQGQVFSTKSDVWSFGVVVWEVLSRTEPFPTLDAVNAAMKVCYEGLRLPIPPDCHPGFAAVMKACWQLEPSARPSFEQICDDLSKLETRKTLSNPPKPLNSLEHSNSYSSSIQSGNESGASMDTTYTSARRSGLSNNNEASNNV